MELSAEAVLAATCPPMVQQAVEIDGEHYWDGGYMGNPAVFPLVRGCDSRDVLIVHASPLARAEVPRTAQDIMRRVNEISFNASLMREMKPMLIHAIAADEALAPLSASSMLNADGDFLQWLKAEGRRHAGAWIEDGYDRIGNESTVDIRGTYL